MSNVIDLFEKHVARIAAIADEDLKDCSYTKQDNENIGLAMRNGSMAFIPLNFDEFMVTLTDLGGVVFNRAELAEFIHVAKILIDDEDKWAPEGELIGLDYE